MLVLGEKGKVMDIDAMTKDPKFGQPYDFGNGFTSIDTKWFPRDTIHLFQEHMKVSYKKQQLEKYGWTEDNISYKLNAQSFRHDGTVPDFYNVSSGGIAYVGDSITFGVGLNLEDLFTYRAHPKELPYLNLGCPGGGLESYYRVVKKWVPIIKPKLLCVFHTWVQSRSEYSVKSRIMHYPYNQNGEDTLHRYHPRDVQIRWHKNIEAIKHICHETGTKVWVMEEPSIKYKRFYKLYANPENDFNARDLAHPGVYWNSTLVEDFKTIISDNF